MQVPTYLPCVLSLRSLSSGFDRFLPGSAVDSVDAVLRPSPASSAGRRPLMRQGPTHSPRNSDPRPTPPNGIDSTRAGIRALDCGDERNAAEMTIVRRATSHAVSSPLETDAGDRGD